MNHFIQLTDVDENDKLLLLLEITLRYYLIQRSSAVKINREVMLMLYNMCYTITLHPQ